MASVNVLSTVKEVLRFYLLFSYFSTCLTELTRSWIITSFHCVITTILCILTHTNVYTFKENGFFISSYGFFIMLWSLQVSHVSSTADIISINESISGEQSIVSNGDVFELGLFSPDASYYCYIGMWYKQVSPRTIVWVANPELPEVSSCKCASPHND